MIIFLSELQKNHLKLLHTQPVQVLVDFCKLAVDYLDNGLNKKKCEIAAEKLNVTAVDIENLLSAILFLLVEACKNNLSEAHLKSSLAIAGFSNEHLEVLIKLYESKRSDISESLHLLQKRDPIYQDLHWRFEVQVSTRNHSEQVKPNVALDFVLRQPKNFHETLNNCTEKPVTSSEVSVNRSIEEANTASECQNIIRHVKLQCDLPNLLHITNKLEQALKESKCQHVRKVQRAFQ